MAGDQKRYLTRNANSILGAFNVNGHQLISLVGGGGKTSTMFGIARALVLNNYTAITTTTTHIAVPTEEQTPYIYVRPEGGLEIDKIKDLVKEHKHITVVNMTADGQKAFGLTAEEVDALFAANICDSIICEADGASQRPVKCPRETEPVVPLSTTLTIPVVGMDALYAVIGSEKTFRDEYICKVTGLSIGDELGEDAIAKIVTDEHGLIQYAPKSSAIIPFLNKIDITGRRAGEDLAKAILDMDHPQIDRVIIGAMYDPLRQFTIIQKS